MTWMVVTLFALLAWSSWGGVSAPSANGFMMQNRETSVIAFNDWSDDSSDHQLSRKPTLLVRTTSGEPKIPKARVIHKNAEPLTENIHVSRGLAAMDSNTGCRAPPATC